MIGDTQTPDLNRPMPEPFNDKTPVQKKVQPLPRTIDFVSENAGFHGGPQKRAGLRLAIWTWLSATIDALVLTSMSCFFIVAFSFLMKTPAQAMLINFIQHPQLGQLFFGSFLVSLWIYMITMRVLMGASMGEWTCHLRLGQPMQRLQLSYLFKVTARTTLILLSGIVFFPLLSLIFRRDIVGSMTGLKIYSLK